MLPVPLFVYDLEGEVGSRLPPCPKKRSAASASKVLRFDCRERGSWLGKPYRSSRADGLGGRSAGYPSSSMCMIWPGTVANLWWLAMCPMPCPRVPSRTATARPSAAPVMTASTGWWIDFAVGAQQPSCRWMINFLRCKPCQGLHRSAGLPQGSVCSPLLPFSNGARMALGGRAQTSRLTSCCRG